MNTSKLQDTLNLLRISWKEGEDLLNKMTKNDESYFWPEYAKWNTKTGTFIKHLFYNQDFFELYNSLDVYDQSFNNGNSLELKETLGNKIGFIEAHSALFKLGYLKDQGVGIDNSTSKIAFVAMWFSESTNDTYSLGIKPAVEENLFDPLRIDKLEHNEKIDEKILEKIRDSRFLIADYTGHRGGVYFEAGYAKGLGLPVIPICKKGEEEKLHFDVKMYNTIIYKDIEDLKIRLEQRIKETIGVFRNVESTNAIQFLIDNSPF